VIHYLRLLLASYVNDEGHIKTVLFSLRAYIFLKVTEGRETLPRIYLLFPLRVHWAPIRIWTRRLSAESFFFPYFLQINTNIIIIIIIIVFQGLDLFAFF